MHVAVDLGAESGRVIAGDLRKFEVIHRFPSATISVHEHLHWDIRKIFADIKAGLARAFIRYGGAIESIGIDAWGVDYALLDADDHLISDPYHYRDSRTDGMMDELREKLGSEYIYRKTGIQFLPFNTIYQLYSEQKHQPERLAAARSFLTIPDLLGFWLSGEKANEFTNATTTQLYNPVIKDWDRELIGRLGIPESIFLDVIPSGTLLGNLLPELQDEIGTHENIRVIAPACHDTGSAVAAIPLVEGGGSAYLSSGTWSLLGTELNKPLISSESLEVNFTNEGSADGGIRFLKNIMGLWILQECRKEWKIETGVLSYDAITELAGSAGGTVAIFDVDDPRFLKPATPDDPMSERIKQWCVEHQIRAPQGYSQIARSILESLASRYAAHIQTLENLIGETISRLHVIGGGCQNALLCQLTANRAGIPVYAGPVEATALGNILVQRMACGKTASLMEGRGIIAENSTVMQYSPRRTDCLEEGSTGSGIYHDGKLR